MASSTAQSSKFSAKDNDDIERQVAQETVGLSLAQVESKVSAAYTEYTAVSKSEGANSRAGAAALLTWALLGRYLDSMQSKFQQVSSIAVVAGSRKERATGSS